MFLVEWLWVRGSEGVKVVASGAEIVNYMVVSEGWKIEVWF